MKFNEAPPINTLHEKWFVNLSGSDSLLEVRRNEDWNGRTGVATLRPKDGESPEQRRKMAQKDPAASRISRVRTCDTGMTRFLQLAEPRTNKAR
ncbi:hypothetical protein G5I_05244 [Acromyrmex echinatior]|uniref:Uncharacterized protein n=1 Tax=Acromyrmex echinatior TaxID=103372 RepID=F4WHS4_ACREC|nr:hypothetical protein G5I_05244 [Acromyrmex echinatior]